LEKFLKWKLVEWTENRIELMTNEGDGELEKPAIVAYLYLGL